MSSSSAVDPGFTYPVTVEIPWAIVDAVRQNVISGFSRNAVVPGFRRGRVPQSVLNRHYERDVIAALARDLVPLYMHREVAERDVEVCWGPSLEELDFEEGAPLRAVGTFEVFPEFTLGEYRGLQVEQPSAEVTEEMVEDYLEHIRQRHSSFQNVDPRPLEDGDVAVVSAEIFAEEGKKLSGPDEIQFEVGASDTPEDLTKVLLGAAPGDQIDAEVSHPPDYWVQAAAGRTLRYRGEVLGLGRRELPELDDEFAADVDSSLSTLAELREHIREQLEEYVRRSVDDSLRWQVIKQLVSAHPMGMPPKYFTTRLYERAETANAEGELDSKDGLDQEAFLQLQMQMVDVITLERVLDRIAFVEGISVQDAELMEFVEGYGKRRQLTTKRAIEELRESGGLANARAQLARNKALQLVVDEAELCAPGEAQGDSAAEDADSASDGVS